MARKISMKQAINEALDQEMTRDPSVIVHGRGHRRRRRPPGEKDAWGGVLGVTKGLYPKSGDRLMDTPCRSRRTSARPSARPRPACARWPS